MSPKRSDLILATHVPHCEANVLVLYCLHIEPCITVREIERGALAGTTQQQTDNHVVDLGLGDFQGITTHVQNIFSDFE